MTKKAIENPAWTMLAALVGIVTLALSGIQIYQAFRTPPEDLEVAMLSIDGQDRIDLAVADAGTAGSVGVTPVDITLKNSGGMPSLITQIHGEVVYFQQLEDCTATPPKEAATAAYQLAIPVGDDLNAVEDTISEDVRFEIRPGAVDRMLVTIGPKYQHPSASLPTVMAIKLTLIHDGDRTLDIGTVSLVTTVEDANAQIESAANPDPITRACAKRNLAHLDELFAIQSTRSSLLATLRATYRGIA